MIKEYFKKQFKSILVFHFKSQKVMLIDECLIILLIVYHNNSLKIIR
jgi:hypothetical protein